MKPNDDSNIEFTTRSEFQEGCDATVPEPGREQDRVPEVTLQAKTDREVLADARKNRLRDNSARHARRRPKEASWSEATSRLFWILATATIVICVWRVGPKIIEEYQYAMTAGKVRAQYQVAVDLLKDNPLGNVSQAYQLVAQKIRPSVVSVRTDRPREGTRGQGSGVVMSKDGYILTNAHVVDKAGQITVSLYDRHEYLAKPIGVDFDSDLAVVKIDAPNLIPAMWGDSERLKVGSIVWAIGSPYGLDQTVTSGIISGKNRRDEDHQNRELLQTDAAVNPGNSGGPLVDATGTVIGINTSIFGETFQGISFAVPSTIASFVFHQLIEHGRVTRGYLGVRPHTVFQHVAAELDLPNLDGAHIRYVDPNSPAYRGGLRDNDVILSWNDKPVTLHSTLFRYVEMTPPNEAARVLVAREGKLEVFEVTVGDRADARR